MSKPVKRKCPSCGKTKSFRSDQKSCGCKPPVAKAGISPQQQVELELEKLKLKKEEKSQKSAHLQEKVILLEKELDILTDFKSRTPQIFEIQPKVNKGTSESVCFMIASDWHIEEPVYPGAVGYKNEFNLEIGKQRVTSFFQGGIRLFDIMRRDTNIKTIVLGLIGDFISGSIHEDLAESNLLPPSEAIFHAQNLIISGVKYMLTNTPPDTQLILVCHGGNHGRMTKEQRHATETGNSLEQFMYYNIQEYFANESRIVFQVAEGYHSYLKLFDGKYVVRFHHGHDIKYGGGVGGIFIPTNKAIAQWNKATPVNLDVFGHYHTLIDAGNFVANGALIGYNSFAVAIKADFEKPQQAFFLVNKKYNAKSMFTPIFL
jgi:hypothetical protein